MQNSRIADIFEEIADLLELQKADRFRIRSYRNAAQTLRGHSARIEDMVDDGEDLSKLHNIGKSTAEKIVEILRTGTCKRLEDLRRQVPKGLTQVMKVPGVGPRRAMQLYEELQIESLKDLRSACAGGEVSKLEGFGAKSESKILEGIKILEKTSGRMLYKEAKERVKSLGRHLDEISAIERWEAAGSYRRRLETVGDLDILISAGDREEATERILGWEEIDEVLGRGEERITVRTTDGLQVDFRFFESGAYGAALLYFTGSKSHNIALRKLAQKRGWKLNEYGLFKGERLLAGRTEESVYGRLNLPLIPPELREDSGEIQAAQKDALPELIELKDIRGDLQCHTTASDGKDTIDKMARAARHMGYQYLAITDHSKRVTMANGLDDSETLRHAEKIRDAGASMSDFWLMAGIEVDILKSGALDLKESTLEQLDWVVASVHYDRNMDRKSMTGRIVSAVQSGVVHCLGHPMGRLIGKRKELDVDVDEVLQACREAGVWVEINAHPERLDLPDSYCRQAAEDGVKFTISTDAHDTDGLKFMEFGVNAARRGWLTRGHVLNTSSAGRLRRELG